MEICQILHGLSCLSPPAPCLSFVPIAIHPDHILFFHSSLSPSPMAVSTLHLPPMPPFPSSTISTPTSARASVSTSLKPNLSISFPYSRLQGPLHLPISPTPPSPSPRTPTHSKREEGERDGGHRNTGPRAAAPIRSRHFLRPPVDPQWALSGLRRRSHTPAVAHRHFFQGGQFLARARSTPSGARATYLAHSAAAEVDRAIALALDLQGHRPSTASVASPLHLHAVLARGLHHLILRYVLQPHRRL